MTLELFGTILMVVGCLALLGLYPLVANEKGKIDPDR